MEWKDADFFHEDCRQHSIVPRHGFHSMLAHGAETKSTNKLFFSRLPPIIIIIIYDIEKGDGGKLITIYDFLWRRKKTRKRSFYESWDQNDRMELATLSWIQFENSLCNRFSRITFLYVIHIEAWSQTEDINSDGERKAL